MRAYRIGDPAGHFPVWSAAGSRLAAGRWHAADDAVIYASEHYSTALLEVLARENGTLPRNQHFVEITLPRGTSYEVATADTVPGWEQPDGQAARRFGSAWYMKNRSAILIVPSVVARMERNIVINTRHPDFARLTVGLETPVWWDQRLFGSGQP